MSQFPDDLLARYKTTTVKLAKLQRSIFKRTSQNYTEVSEEFNQLGIAFNNSFLPEYAALCWLGASKCEKALDNNLAEVEYLIRSAQASIQADKKEENLHLLSNNRSHLEAALQCYNQASLCLPDDSVKKVAIIRAMKKIQPSIDATSSFHSPPHRIYDLEMGSDEKVRVGDYVSALEKRTEIFDNIFERKVENLYSSVLQRNEITRVLLILLLELPPSRLSPSHIKLIEQFTKFTVSSPTIDLDIPIEVILILQELVASCQKKNFKNAKTVVEQMLLIGIITKSQQLILLKLKNKLENS